MAKRLGPILVTLSLTGCVLNPQGEDPGYEENSSGEILGAPNATGAIPGAFDPGGPGPVTPGSSLDPSGPNGGVIDNPVSPTGPGLPGLGPSPGVAPTPAGTMPDATPTPMPFPPLGAGGAAGVGGSSGAAGGPAIEPEPEMEPGMDFDGGTFNYGKDTDGGANDEFGDGGLIDAGVGL